MPLLYKGTPHKDQLLISTNVIFGQTREEFSKGVWSYFPESRYYMIFDLWKYTTHDKFYNSGDHLGKCLASLSATPVCGGYTATSFLLQRKNTTDVFWEQKNIMGIVKGNIDMGDPRVIKKFMKQVTKRYHPQILTLFEKGVFGIRQAFDNPDNLSGNDAAWCFQEPK